MSNKYSIYFTPESIIHLKNIEKYYNNLKIGLGKTFLSSFKSSTKKIKKNPFYASIRYSSIRFSLIKKFPYAIHYNIEHNNVIIYAVLGFSEDPEKWTNLET